MATAALGLRRARRGRERGRFWRGEWAHGREVPLQERLGGSGGAGIDGRDGCVLCWLGGIPPSSLEARGGRRQRDEWAGPLPRAPGKLFPFSVCLIFPFLFSFL